MVVGAPNNDFAGCCAAVPPNANGDVPVVAAVVVAGEPNILPNNGAAGCVDVPNAKPVFAVVAEINVLKHECINKLPGAAGEPNVNPPAACPLVIDGTDAVFAC